MTHTTPGRPPNESSQRALAIAKEIPLDMTASEQATYAYRAAMRAGISDRSVRRARRVLHHGTADLVAAVADGHLAVNTAERVAATVDATRQDEFARSVLAGLPISMITPSVARLASRAPTGRGSTNGRRHVQLSAVDSMINTLDGMGALLERTGRQLSPEVTPAEARAALQRLRGATPYVRQLTDLLKERSADA